MSETIHIKALADRISEEIFGAFGWVKKPPTDYRWNCVEREKHGKVKSLVHPTDVVFAYDDPYEAKKIYVNCDLKSYAASTLDSYNPHKDILSLASAVECAKKSKTFRELFIYDGEPWTVEGLLFVYNHDAGCDRDFEKVIIEKAPKQTRIPDIQRIFIYSPQRIQTLYTIAKDIDWQIGKARREGTYLDSGFVAPDLAVSKVKGKSSGPATLSMLNSSWVIHELRSIDGSRSLVVYFSEINPEVDDFKFLIDALLDFQLLANSKSIDIRIVDAKASELSNFAQAKNEYAEENHGVTDESLETFKSRLNGIVASSVERVSPSFFELEIALQA